MEVAENQRGSSSKKAAHEGKEKNLITYSCQKCCKLDLQVSICLKTIMELLHKHEGGFTDSLDDMDPVVKRLFQERGYEERRRRTARASKSSNFKTALTVTDSEKFSVG